MESNNKCFISNTTLVRSICIIGSCPALYETENEYLVVGRQVPLDQLEEAVKRKVGSREAVVAIPKELLNNQPAQ
jgi:hypothetical protein